MERHPDDLTDVPTAAEYKKALLACRSALKSSGGQSLPLDMLRVIYQAPDHTLTAGELAANPEVNLASYKAANLNLGRYAKTLSAHFGREPKFQISMLVRFQDGSPGEEHVKWTMHPEVVTALEELGWVKPQA